MAKFRGGLFPDICGAAALAALLALAAPALAWADEDYANPDRPGLADGSSVVGTGRFQIEAGLQQELRRADGGRDSRLFIPTLLRLGLSDRWELRMETSGYQWERAPDPGFTAAREEGMNPVSLGFKYHFIDDGGAMRPSVSVIGRAFAPSGSGPYRTQHVNADVRLVADWNFAPQWSLNPNIGLGEYEDGDGRLFTAGLVAMTLSYNPDERLSLFVDTGQQYPETRNAKGEVTIDAGVAWMASRDIQLDFSLGTGVAGRTPPHPFISVGVTRRF